VVLSPSAISNVASAAAPLMAAVAASPALLGVGVGVFLSLTVAAATVAGVVFVAKKLRPSSSGAQFSGVAVAR